MSAGLIPAQSNQARWRPLRRPRPRRIQDRVNGGLSNHAIVRHHQQWFGTAQPQGIQQASIARSAHLDDEKNKTSSKKTARHLHRQSTRQGLGLWHVIRDTPTNWVNGFGSPLGIGLSLITANLSQAVPRPRQWNNGIDGRRSCPGIGPGLLARPVWERYNHAHGCS